MIGAFRPTPSGGIRRAGIARAILAAGVAGAVGVMTGCASIPSEGPVESGLSDLAQDEQYVQFINPSGPVEGSSQEDIVRGFLLAAQSDNEDYSVAREFLTNAYQSQWDPSDGVIIDDGARPFRSEGSESGSLSLDAIAKVDRDGALLPVQPGPSTQVRFEFAKVGGEWRISSAPSGIILDSTTFTTIWSPQPVYFVNNHRQLVPETRWFLRRATLPTEIVNALLDGPSEALSGVVHSGFAQGTKLSANSVPVSGGTAKVDFSSNLLDANDTELGEIAQQVKYSLQHAPSVNSVDLLAEGVKVEAGAAGNAKPISTSVSPNVISNGKFGSVDSGKPSGSGALAANIAGLDPAAVSLSSDGKRAGVLNGAGASVVSSDGVSLVDDRSGLVEPSVDEWGVVWTVPRTGNGAVQAFTADGSTLALPAKWLSGQKLTAFRVSPDGTRVAALVSYRDGEATDSQVLVAGIVRDDDGTPTGLTETADTQLWAEGKPRDLDWVGQQRFAVLSGSTKATQVTIGGPGLLPTQRGDVPGGVSIFGSGSQNTLRVLGANEQLFAPQGSGWQLVKRKVEVLAKQG